MPKTKNQTLLYALIVVLITVPCFVFYCAGYEAGGFSLQVVKDSWVYIPLELVLAYFTQLLVAGPALSRVMPQIINPKQHDPLMTRAVGIVANATIMCCLMSLFATIIYSGIIPIQSGSISTNEFLVNLVPFWLQKIVLNFPFTLITQMCFIQPLSGVIFRSILNSRVAQSFSLRRRSNGSC